MLCNFDLKINLMKRIITLCLLAFTTMTQAQTQNFEWLETIAIDINASSDLITYATTTDANGNIYMAGIKDNISFNCVDLMGALIYNKYNATGSLIYSKMFTGTGSIFAMKTDTDGNVLMTIGYTNSLTIGSTTLTANEFTPNFSIVKLDPAGNLLWHNQLIMEGAEEWDVVSSLRAITLDSDNNAYVGYDNFFNSFVDKYSPTGEKLLTITQSQTNRITSMSVDPDGNIYTAGSCASIMANFAGVDAPPPAEFNYNTYLVKYNAAGEYQWVKYVNDITCPEPQVVAHSADEIYLSSALWQPTQFDDFELQGPSSFFGDFYLAKLNSEGVYQWVSEVPETQGEVTIANRNSLHVDAFGNPYIIGKTRMSINWTPEITTTVEGFSNDAIVIKYNPEGQVTMAKTAGAVDFEDRFDGISSNAEGDIFLSGVVTGGNVFFDDIEREYPQWGSVPFLVKMSNGILSVDNVTNPTTTALYPNPASNHIYITNMETGTKGSIYNTIGQKVLDFTMSNDTPIAVNELPAGTYFVKTEGQKAIQFIKY